MGYHTISDSLMRHLLALLDGQDRDPESGLHHIDHIAANVGFLAEFIKNGKITEDRHE
jgi:hypothetical protein